MSVLPEKRPTARDRRVVRPRARLTAALALLLACACSEASDGPEDASPDSGAVSAPPPNVLLVVLDTVRADHLSCYGYERNTSPAIDAFAQRSRRFTRAFSSSPWTLPSHASLFTGLDPSEHRVQTIVTPDLRVGVRPLRDRFFTLAEGFTELGYRTGAFIANYSFLQPKYGLSQGFETYQVKHEPGIALNLQVFEWLDQEDERPWFLFVNYMDAHRPYVSHPRPAIVPEPVDRDGMKLLEQLIEEVMPADGTREVDTELVQGVIDQYDLGIASADEAFGRLLERVEARPDAPGTVVVITSDHGEYFGEHDLVEHSKDVYQPALWVPLVIGVLGETVSEVDERSVVSANLPHLLLTASGHVALERLGERFPKAPEEHLPRIYNAYAREKDVRHPVWGHRFRRIRNATIDWPWKFIHSSDGAHELYHLERDPGELENLVDAQPEVAARLLEKLVEADEGSGAVVPEAEVPEMTPEERERMRALGYVE